MSDKLPPALEHSRKKRPPWLTRAMAEDFTRHEVLVTTFKETLVYIIFIAAVTMFTIGRKDASLFYITQALMGQFVETPFQTTNDVEIKFKEIKTAADFWKYAETLLIDSFYWEAYYNPYDPIAKASEDDQKILFENKLLGVPRIRQVKMTNDSCAIHHYFRRLFLTCYANYEKSKEDRKPFGKGTGTAWVYNDEESTKSIEYEGEVADYSGGGYYQDLAKNRNESQKIVKELKESLWITRGTRAIFVDFSLYNANLNLFCICKLIFEFPPTGGVKTSHSFQAVFLLGVHGKKEIFLAIAKYVVLALLVFYIIEELNEMWYFRWRYLLQFWTYIDLTIIGMGVADTCYRIFWKPNIENTIQHIMQNPDMYGNLEMHAHVRTGRNEFGAALLFFTYIKTFKYLNFNKTMGQLNNTLKRCALDIVGFSIMFFIIFFAFAELGYLLFGSQVEDFSTFGIAMFTLLRTILGDFDYQAIEQANRVLAPIYFLSYIFFVFFVLLNMFLAIINDTYADVKTEISIAPDEMQMTEFLKTGLYNILRKMGIKIKDRHQQAEYNTTIHHIRDALKKCGFSDLEIEMFFARYNVDPLAEAGTYDIKAIMKDLQGPSAVSSDATSLVQIRDFIAQQERLTQIEHTIEKLASRVEVLITKLDTVKNVR